MLQSLAIQNQIPQLTNESYESDPTYDKLLAFSDSLKTEWIVKSKSGFFFHADDFISFVRKNAQLRNELLHECYQQYHLVRQLRIIKPLLTHDF